jgi:eukaryotic-like serine/threonine-protein kinase
VDAGTWRRAKDIFADALARTSEERAAFVAHACGTEGALLDEVEALLAAHHDASLFLESRPELPPDLFPGSGADIAEPLTDGTLLGPYRCERRIGAGGMGSVYKARDLRLNRTVAIKVLPSHLANDNQAGERFEREGRAVAALNHPNICTLYDVGREDGIAFLVMEYLEGETLATRLQRSPLKREQALHFAIQIASALERVHRAGLVHRDLKPSNIMLTNAGTGSAQVKLLDFGIAKTLSASPDTSSASTPTNGSAVTPGNPTAIGMILGTIRYMAPEQIDGGPTDARSDLFAFGAVLYEMFTGSPAFDGPRTSALVAAIHDQPPPSAALDPAINRIVHACLEKHPDDRWQTARDLLRELQWAREEPQVPGAGRESGSAAKRRRWLGAGAAMLAAISLIAAYGAVGRRPLAADVLARFEIATPPTSDPMSFALSPDGRQLVFVATQGRVPKLWVRLLDDLNARPIDGTDGASFPFWSPDGQAIAYFANGKLRRVGLHGDRVYTIADAANGRGGAWARSGIILFAPSTAGALLEVAADGGTPRPATQLSPGQVSHRWPQVLADGSRFVYLSTQGQPGTSGVFMGSLAGGDATRVLDDDSPAAYTAGRLLVVHEGALLSLPFNPNDRRVAGEPTIVAKPVGFDTQLARGAYSVSASGVLAYRSGVASERQLIWFDRDGRRLGPVGLPDANAIAAPELSPDGRQVAVFRNVDGNDDVWTIPIEGGVPTRLTFAPNLDGFPIWTRDGRGIIYTAFHQRYTLVARTLNGEERSLFKTSGLKIANDISPDGRLLLYAVQVPASGVDLWTVPLASADDDARPIAQTPFDEMSGQFAPNGKWIAYQSNASGQMEIYVRPFPGPGAPQQVSLGGGSQPRWSPGGSELFYVAADGRMTAVAIANDPSPSAIRAGAPRPLFQTHLATGANIPPAVASKPQYAIAPDGRFLINVAVEGAPAPPIVVSIGSIR